MLRQTSLYAAACEVEHLDEDGDVLWTTLVVRAVWAVDEAHAKGLVQDAGLAVNTHDGCVDKRFILVGCHKADLSSRSMAEALTFDGYLVSPPGTWVDLESP